MVRVSSFSKLFSNWQPLVTILFLCMYACNVIYTIIDADNVYTCAAHIPTLLQQMHHINNMFIRRTVYSLKIRNLYIKPIHLILVE